jgi:hypothetical protein
MQKRAPVSALSFRLTEFARGHPDMRTFSTDWLALREPLDAASRAAGLGAIAIEILRHTRLRDPCIRVVDLGAGDGANLRYTAPRLQGSQDWLLVDWDPVMLDAMNGRMQLWANSFGVQAIESGRQLGIRAAEFECRVQSIFLDLATQLDRLALPPRTLVGGSALLDLVSERWLRNLAQRAADAAATVWFTLIYDGRIDCSPAEPEDLEVRELFNRHQLTDKGFGPALGPAAGRMVERIFAERGYRTWRAPSDWHVGPAQRALQHALLDGWFGAACEIAPKRAVDLRKWRARRRAHIDDGRSELIVGHVDVAGRPPCRLPSKSCRS